MIQFACRRCGRSLQVADSAAGKQTRCGQCQQVLIAPRESEAASFLEARTAGATQMAGDMELNFGAVKPTDVRRSEVERDQARRRFQRLRLAVLLPTVLGTAVGAGVAAARAESLEAVGICSLAAFIGLLLGVSVGVIYGAMHEGHRRASAHDAWLDLPTDDDPLALFTAFLSMANAKSGRKPDNLLALASASGAVLGAGLGAELGQLSLVEEAVAFGWYGFVGALVGGLLLGGLSFAGVLLWRR